MSAEKRSLFPPINDRDRDCSNWLSAATTRRKVHCLASQRRSSIITAWICCDRKTAVQVTLQIEPSLPIGTYTKNSVMIHVISKHLTSFINDVPWPAWEINSRVGEASPDYPLSGEAWSTFLPALLHHHHTFRILLLTSLSMDAMMSPLYTAPLSPFCACPCVSDHRQCGDDRGDVCTSRKVGVQTMSVAIPKTSILFSGIWDLLPEWRILILLCTSLPRRPSFFQPLANLPAITS